MSVLEQWKCATRVCRHACVVMALATIAGASAPCEARSPDDPEQLAREALEASPTLEALRARIAALRASASAAGSWQDPVVRLEYANVPTDSFRLDERPQSALVLGVQQTVPPWGWSALRERVADERARTSEHELAEARLQLRHDVRRLFHRLTLSRQLEGVTRENLRRTRELLRVVEARYQTGGARQHELLRIQVLSDRLADELLEFERADRELSASLARALARAPGATFVTPRELAARAPADSPRQWLERALASRPELKRLAQAAQTADTEAELAALEARPPVTFQLAYRVRTLDTPIDDGTDQVAASVTVPIPVGSRARSRAEATVQLQTARRERARLAAEVDRIEEELAGIHARWTRAYEKARTYRDVLAPGARSALETALSEYAVGRAGFTTLYEAELDLLQIESALLDAAAQTWLEAARLEAAIGTSEEGAR